MEDEDTLKTWFHLATAACCSVLFTKIVGLPVEFGLTDMVFWIWCVCICILFLQALGMASGKFPAFFYWPFRIQSCVGYGFTSPPCVAASSYAR